MIKSPYNFVPAPSEKEVFIPNWADQVSHDIPFSDGESGEIEFTITAETPIFIRNGHAQGKDTSEFCNVDGKYFIPATSIKGMLRNVLEIMSRGRMIQVDNNHHAIRQIMKPKSVLADEGYELIGDAKRKINAGWLVQKGQDYYLFDCGKPYKIRYTDLDKKLKTNFWGHFGEEKLTDLSCFDNKTGAYKYNSLLTNKVLEHTFEKHPRDEDDKQKSWVSKFQHLDYVRFHDQHDSDLPSFEGTIVCTGQATDYVTKNSTARKGEYVFEGNKRELFKNDLKAIKLSKEAVDAFKFINRNNQPDELKDWSYWKKKVKEGIPVFFRWEEENKSIKDLGLTFMYKTPAKNDIYSLLPYEFEKGKLIAKTLDLAETIFGSVRNEKLKGRVFISNAKLSENTPAKILPEVRVALSNPKSSFYPNYLVQDGKNGKTSKFNTFNTGATLRGYKRYPLKRKLIDNQGTGDMSTAFKPLDKGSRFNCKIRFHNLREVEIGALLSCLTFHKSDPNIFHSIGMGKPLGYGAIKIEINKINFLEHTENDYLKAFENEMRLHDKNWGNDQFIKELFQMATFQTEEIENHLVYPKLENFQEYKNNGDYLPKYSEITKIETGVKNLLSDEEVQNAIDIKNADKIKADKLRTEWEEQLKKSNDIQIESKLEEFIAKCPYDDLKDGLINVLKNVKEKNTLVNDKNNAIELNTLEGYEMFLTKYKDSIFENEIRSKLKALKASELALNDLIFNKYDFEDIKKEVNKLMKNKLFQFSGLQKLQIYEALKLSWDIENNKGKKSAFLKKDKLAKISDYPWSDISRWLDLEAAQSLYNELTKP